MADLNPMMPLQLCELLVDVAKASEVLFNMKPECIYATALRERIKNPVRGDIVVELTGFPLVRIDPEAIGVFEGRIPNLDHPDGDEQSEECYLWKVRALLTGKCHNWANCDFMTLPTAKIREQVHNSLDNRQPDSTGFPSSGTMSLPRSVGPSPWWSND